ncbi:serine hydrolase [Chitinophaga lutea]|uniref:Serine hydrolase n=1 Tax=Chitinophaga lutea TaxID=2488634 RepID=A0A3N4PVV6_9BACT|nr:serine hydrolase [Chitinophaga lutea]RPE09221.1 serine hydrolase [Chitinophaga lutea]
MNRQFYSPFRTLLACSLLMLPILPGFAQTKKKLDSLFETLHRQGVFNGCVLIAEEGRPVYKKAFGYANFETKQLLHEGSVFELASVAKQFTAMAIMQLQDRGKLSYQDDIGQYFPSLHYPGVTIDNLLRHTSGIPEFLPWDETRVDVTRINYNKDILDAMVKSKLPALFKPGEMLAYSNTNYVLLALIVEKISGMPFADYLDKNIFRPLNMTDSRVYARRAASKVLDNYALGHVYSPAAGRFVINDSVKANRYQYYFDGVAGPYGISSNTEDLLKWDHALYTGRLIRESRQQLAYVPGRLNNGSVAAFAGLAYGYGWLILPPDETTGRRYMHSGGYPGYMTIIARYPEKKKTIIILTNIYNVVSLYQLCGATENILFDKPFSMPTPTPFMKSVALSPAQLKTIEGVYTLAPGFKFTITTELNQAYAQLTGQPKVEIYPSSENEFFYTVVTARLRFEKDSAGVAKKLTLFQNGKEMEARRD